ASPRAISTENRELPRTNLERAIANVWEQVLGVSGVGVHESLLSLGGDSLVAVRIASRLDEMFGVSIHPKQLLADTTTIEQMSIVLVKGMASARKQPVADVAVDETGNVSAT